jgi:hypothetical protein
MTQKRKRYSLKIIPDKDVEKFSRSTCTCKTCKAMHLSELSELEWDTFVPKTHLQKRMFKAIKNIEKKYKK